MALYIRVSSKGQVKDGYSLDFQEQILREFCEREGYTIAELYRDGGVSGSTIQRKDLMRLIEDAKQRKFDLVLIFRVDRFSRDPLDLLALVRQLEVSSIRLRSVTEAVDASDPAGELMLTLLGAIGKFVRSNIMQNAALGKAKRAEAGKYTGGKIPFGYALTEDGHYTPDNEVWYDSFSKADLVRKAFALYAESIATGCPGTGYVIDWFNLYGVPSPDGKGWTRTTVSQMLRHATYTGVFTYAKRSQQLGKPGKANPEAEWVQVANAHEPLVSAELFAQVQHLKSKLAVGGRPRKTDEHGLLSGFAVCAVCGSALAVRRVNQGRNIYYVCGSRVNDTRKRRGTACTDFPWIPAATLEELVWAEVHRVAEDPVTISELLVMLQNGAAPQRAELTTNLVAFKQRFQDVEKEEMTITTAYAQGKMPQHLWEKQLARIEQERNKVSHQLQSAERELAALSQHPAFTMNPAQIVGYLQQIFTQGVMSFTDKRKAFGLLLKDKGITVSPTGAVKITLQLPIDEAACALHIVKPDVATRHSVGFGKDCFELPLTAALMKRNSRGL